MRRRMFLSKIHRAVITHADLDYEGSCTIDADLMDVADIVPNQELHVWNITQGTRLVAQFQQVIKLRVEAHCVNAVSSRTDNKRAILPAITGLPRPPADA